MGRMFISLIVASQLLAACSSGATTSASCVELREAEDPQSGRHVLTEDGLVYLTDPPTSGPHGSGASPEGALSFPLIAPIQVRVLEGAGVVVQYASSVSDADVAELAAFADEIIVVAPAASELTAPIVATAWTWKLTCDTLDTARITTFASERRVDAPGFD